MHSVTHDAANVTTYKPDAYPITPTLDAINACTRVIDSEATVGDRESAYVVAEATEEIRLLVERLRRRAGGQR